MIDLAEFQIRRWQGCAEREAELSAFIAAREHDAGDDPAADAAYWDAVAVAVCNPSYL